jgi:hypothetical protein
LLFEEVIPERSVIPKFRVFTSGARDLPPAYCRFVELHHHEVLFPGIYLG